MNMGPYPAICRDWHDGDTGHFDLDLGFANYALSHDLDGKPILSCRVFGINAPELSSPDGSGKAALAYAEKFCPPGTRVVILSHGWDKYGGRFDGQISLPMSHQLKNGSPSFDLAALMLDAGMAVVETA